MGYLYGAVNQMEARRLISTYRLRWRFVGHGRTWATSSDNVDVMKTKTTLKKCIAICEVKRINNGTAWNGLTWQPKAEKCVCFKEEKNHVEDPGYFHYRILGSVEKPKPEKHD